MDDMSLTQPNDSPSDLQRLVDAVYDFDVFATQMAFVLRAENYDFDEDVMEVVGLLPPGTYHRQALCDQLNSIVTAHGWGSTVGTVQ